MTLILIHTSTTSLSDDRTKGNTLPIEDGKILVTVRQWSSNSIDPPTDEAVADFLRFLDKYVSLNYGHRALAKYFKLNRDKSLVDKITTEDIAISILIYENSVDVWEEDQRKKEDPNFHPNPASVPKYHVKKGTRIVRFADGWTDEGRAYYKSVCAEIKRLKSIEFFWEGVKEHWKTYAKTHHRSYYERGNTSEAVVEGVIDGDDDNGNNSDDDDCLISLPGDGVSQDEDEEAPIPVTGV